MVAHTDDSGRPADAAQHIIMQLVEKAQAGDRMAFHQLVDHFHSDIFRMIYYRTRSQMDAEDLTQDVFMQAFKYLGRLKKAAVFRSWLYRIAMNRVRDYYRKKQFRSLFGLVSIDADDFIESDQMVVPPDAADHVLRKDFWHQVGRALELLSPKEKEVFLLRFFDQLSIKEITETMGKNESTIKTHLYRALGKVKTAFADMQGLLEGL
jgi:RNA polymerase sigma-70 factor (ECF subfamily)